MESLPWLFSKEVFSPNKTNGDIYVVRPETKYVNDSDSNYPEFHFPSFGRAGTNEKKAEISRNGLLAYMVNLSPRLLQEVDFVLPVYDKVTTWHSAIQNLVVCTWSRTVDKGKFRSVLFHYDANQCGGSLAVNMLSREGAQFFTYDQSSSHVVLIILSLLNRQRLNGIEELD